MSQMCAYVHCKPDGNVFYVGKGKVSRAKNIGKGRRNVWHARTTAKYGLENIGVGIIECSSEAVAFELERGLIKCFKAMGAKLANMTDGGEGKLGCPNSPEAYARAAEKNTGKKRTEEFKQKISERMSGRTVSIETRTKLSTIFKNRPLPEAFRAQLGNRRGADNGKARAVTGSHPEHGTRRFDTLTEAAKFVGGNTSKVCKSIKMNHKHKGWTFVYTENT